MRLAVRELLRRPGRFSVAGGALTLIVVLLLLLGGLLDGLYLGSTGLYRQQAADLVVYSSDARESILRSRIGGEVRGAIEGVDGVDAVRGLGLALVGARVPGSQEIADAAVVGYEGGIAGVPDPPSPGEAYADRRLEASGVATGDVLELGPGRVPVEVVDWVDDVSYLQQGALLVEPGTWRQVLASARPDATLAEEAFQVLVVDVEGEAGDVAAAIDEATAGGTSTLDLDAAISALPGVDAQTTTFNQIIVVTFFVAGLVVALFFAFVTLERSAQYGVLKAIGASSSQIYLGLVTQAIAVTAGAFLLGAAVSLGIARVVPAGIPLQLEPSRAAFVAVGMFLTALAGGSISLRRVVRIDPASAVG